MTININIAAVIIMMIMMMIIRRGTTKCSTSQTCSYTRTRALRAVPMLVSQGPSFYFYILIFSKKGA